jgi:hypothetical protein
VPALQGVQAACLVRLKLPGAQGTGALLAQLTPAGHAMHRTPSRKYPSLQLQALELVEPAAATAFTSHAVHLGDTSSEYVLAGQTRHSVPSSDE